MSASNLLSPINIGKHLLQHRVVLAPLTRLRNTEDGVPQAHCVEYYRQRTTKNGLLITEGTLISSSTFGCKYAPGIFTDKQIDGWKKIVDAVHSKGGIIYNQLWHMGRATSSKNLPDHYVPVSASAIAIAGKNMEENDYEIPHALTIDEIKVAIQEYVIAAKNAMTAGFDGIEIQGGYGYLIDQFLNTSSNIRTDDYGGNIQNRARFGLEVIDAIVSEIGEEKVSIRLTPWSDFQGMKDDDPVETWSYVTQQLQNLHPNLAYIHYLEPRESEPTESLNPFRKIWKGSFITCGGFVDPKEAVLYCDDKPNNLIAFGRIFIANPDLVERIRNNWPLNEYNRATFYTHDLEGFTDYPFYSTLDKKLTTAL